MDKINQVGLDFWSSVGIMWQKLFSTLPNVLVALGIMLLGWLLAKGISYLVYRAVQLSRLEALTSRAVGRDLSSAAGTRWELASMIRKVVYVTTLLLFALFASETLGWQVVTLELGKLIEYLPRLFSAVVIFIMGLYVAGFVRRAIATGIHSFSLQGSSLLSTVVYYIMMALVSITALNQAGIETGAISANFIIIIGSVLFAFALAFGLGARDILGNMLAGLYSRKSFQVGQYIRLQDMEGVIEQMNSISFILRRGDHRVSIPIRRLLEENVELPAAPADQNQDQQPAY